MEEVDEFGLFTRIMLVELIDLANSLYPQKLGVREIGEEINGFVDYLLQFPQRPKGQDVELAFPGKYIKVAIVLVARRVKLAEWGYAPYIRRVEDRLTSDFDTVYVMAMDDLRDVATYVSKRVSEISGIQIRVKQFYGCKYLGEKRKVVCARIQRAG